MWDADSLENYFNEQSDNIVFSESDPCFKASISDRYELMALPLGLIRTTYASLSNTQNWIDWFEREVAVWDGQEEGGLNRWEELEKFFLADPEELPITLHEGSDGAFYIDDGHHRFAILLKNGFKTGIFVVRRI